MPSAAQITTIENAFAQMLATHDTVYYYSALASAGIYYGEMALGVVNDNTFSGIVANNFAENKITKDFGSTSFVGSRGDLMFELASRDHAERSLTTSWELSGTQISNYHDAAFQSVFPTLLGASEAWTPYYEVRALNDYEFWLPSSAGDLRNYLAYARMHVPLNSTTSPEHEYAVNWFQDMELFVFDVTQMEFIVGDNVIGKSIGEFAASLASLNSRSELLLDGDAYKPTNATDVSGFLGHAVHTLFLNEMLQKVDGQAPGEIVNVADGEGVISFDPNDVTAANVDFSEVFNHTLSTVNGLDSASYASNWEASETATIAEAFYGDNPYTSNNVAHALLVVNNQVHISESSDSFIVMQGDIETLSIADSAKVVVVGNDKANMITMTNSSEGIVYGGGGDDTITVVGEKSTSGWTVQPLFIDTGSGNDTVIFDDATVNGNMDAVYILRSGDGHDVLADNTKQLDLSDPQSDYALNVSYILLDGISPDSLHLEKTLVSERQTVETDQTPHYSNELKTDWWDINYKLYQRVRVATRRGFPIPS